MNTKKNTRILILDTTLRDGEQSPGAAMTREQKIAIAQGLDTMGVDIIEAGFAGSSAENFACIQAISHRIRNATLSSLARAKLTDIDAAAKALKFAARPRIHTFLSTSDVHLRYQFKMTHEEALNAIATSVRHARNLCAEVEWSAMDATRSDRDFLARAVETAIVAGAQIINIPDTLGYSTPEEFQQLICALKNTVPGIDKVVLSVHCHNDLGLAVANSLAALQVGVQQVECTINGIGERAGNAALEEIVMTIKTRPDRYPFDIGVNPQHIATLSQLVQKASGFQVQKNKAIVGANAFAHTSGIHQDGMLKERTTYEIITPESVGFASMRLPLSKHSGRAALRHKCTELQLSVPEESFDAVFEKFKQLGDRQKEITDTDIIALITGKNTQKPHESGMIWLDGHFIPWKTAQIPLLSHGLHYASTVFEGARAYHGRVFKLQEHNQRLHRSAQAMGFSLPYKVAELNAATQELLACNGLQDAYIRPVAWCGNETLSVASHTCHVHVAIAAWPWKSYFSDENVQQQGIKLMWADWVRPAPNTAPVTAKASGLYMTGTLSKNKAEQAGFHDALMLDYRGYVAECTGANIFMVKNAVLYTPIADCFLNGITRQTVIEIARKQHIPVIERHLFPHEILAADEVFITGSAVEVLPVTQIGATLFSAGTVTQRLMRAYQKQVQARMHHAPRSMPVTEEVR